MPCVYLPGPAPAVTVANNLLGKHFEQTFALVTEIWFHYFQSPLYSTTLISWRDESMLLNFFFFIVTSHTDKKTAQNLWDILK
jgi:hypothetical protein